MVLDKNLIEALEDWRLIPICSCLDTTFLLNPTSSAHLPYHQRRTSYFVSNLV